RFSAARTMKLAQDLYEGQEMEMKDLSEDHEESAKY
ncbi:unnamed protein product, partial [marine sediment metagenome]